MCISPLWSKSAYKIPWVLRVLFIAYCWNFLHKYPRNFYPYWILIVTLMNRSKVVKNYLCIGKVLLVLTGVSVCCCWAFQLPQLNTSKSFIFHTFIFFGLCLLFARIFWTFLHIYLCQFFCLGFVHPPSFSISLYAFFYICSLVFTSVRHINFIAFSFDYIMLFQTHYSNLVLHSFS